MEATDNKTLENNLAYLKLTHMLAHYESVARTAAQKQWTHVHYLQEMIGAEARARTDRAIKRRIQLARFPQIKTLEQFSWSWPKKINRPQVQNLFPLNFVKAKENVIFIGNTGLGKTHLATALGYQACLGGYTVLFTLAIDAVNNLLAAQNLGRLKQELKKYVKPALLIVDELGYLPIDKTGADLLFQIISKRYEQGSLIITTNRAFKKWPEIFNNDETLTSALLDRLLHHTEVVAIEGPSFRMKEKMEK